jgi:hypothetical protein
MDVLNPYRTRPAVSIVPDDGTRPDLSQPVVTFRPAAVEVHRDVHPAGLDGNRDVQAVRGEQFVPAHQIQSFREPALSGIEQPVLRECPPQCAECRHSDQQVAELQGTQNQQDRLFLIAIRCFHCLASSAEGHPFGLPDEESSPKK